MKNHLRQAGHTVSRSFDFSGRSDRAETIGYLVLSQVPVIAAGLGTAWMEDARLAHAITLAVLVLVTVPVFALAIRRFHDFARSGWWSAPLLVLIGRTLLLEIVGVAAGWNVRATIEAVVSYIDWLLILPAFAGFMAMLIWPSRKETTGTDRSAPVV